LESSESLEGSGGPERQKFTEVVGRKVFGAYV